MPTIVAKLYASGAQSNPNPSRAASGARGFNDTSASGVIGFLDILRLRVRKYFRDQSELRIERMIAQNGGKLTDNIEREITRRLERNF